MEQATHEVATHEVKNCGKTRGRPFTMAYLFTPNGVKAFCGSLDLIRKAANKLPTCHGVVHYYNARLAETILEIANGGNASPQAAALLFRKVVTPSRSRLEKHIIYTDWRMFGLNTEFSGDVPYMSLDVYDPKEGKYARFSEIAYKFRGRKHYVLTWNFKSEVFSCRSYKKQVLGMWRKMPSQYLRQLRKATQRITVPTLIG